MATPTCWIGVAAAAHVRVGRQQGFVMFAHGKHSAVKRLQPGDAFAYYSPTETLGGKDAVRRFTAIGTIAEGAPGPSAVMGATEAWMRRAHYLDAQEADIYLLLPQLDFVSDPAHWGMYFRKSLFSVSAADFSRIAAAMSVGQTSISETSQ
ncbi:EVE domain-containing protein [Devosia ginsengisoli]|uniref:EVE domain-containing protein n=1 Tax=Devosia ginsengisoli TaxID=400770 RepID=UPI0026EBE9C8|nr:EVE domain-containing protein [Devosia ginsengisoli]MCR6671085.1 EVE domain-containing protein [Devosia ginsengisoli]